MNSIKGLIKAIFGLLVFNVLVLFRCTTPEELLATDSYAIESIAMPQGLSGEVGALAFLPSGKLIAAFRRGEVMRYDPETRVWSMFAHGLHLPLGLLVRSESEVLVMQYPELTRVKDTDGDGVADEYENMTDDFGLGGNYHEFAYGPVEDEAGNLYIALNSTSNGGVMMEEVRGELRESGRAEKGMYSAVPYRGWVMQLTPVGELRPYAAGFRSPNGLVIDAKGRLLVTDNQGDWVGTSPLYNVEEGNFYGHPPALAWRKDWKKGKPGELNIETLDSMREKAAVLFPHNIIANSPTQPVLIKTGEQFGPFEGQLLVGEMKQAGVVRIVLEEVNGRLQGACIPFMDCPELKKGVNRLAFGPDGSLWVGQNASGWAGSSGIQRIRYTGRKPVEVHSVQLTEKGFDLVFTEPMNQEAIGATENYTVKSYYYEYHKQYGSDRMDEKTVTVTGIEVGRKGQEVSLALEELEPDRIYEFQLKEFRSVGGDTLAHNRFSYTINQLKNMSSNESD